MESIRNMHLARGVEGGLNKTRNLSKCSVLESRTSHVLA